jgi:FkbM family methyltransferase
MLWHYLRQKLPPGLKIAFRRLRARALDPFDRGTLVTISGQEVLVPSYFRGGGREDYENIAVARFVEWLATAPDALVVDCGCSISNYGLIALTRNPTVELVGIDPDLVSLKCTRALCAKTAQPERLRLIQGFLGPVAPAQSGRTDAETATARALDDPDVPSVVEATGYRETTDAAFAAVPRHSIDALFAKETGPRPRLLKLDVEGFELSVLEGAAGFLRRLRPTILLSSHPQFHAALGTSPEALQAFLRANGYRCTHLATDHEEHWWCVPVA